MSQPFSPLGGVSLSAGLVDAPRGDLLTQTLSRLGDALNASHGDTARLILGPAAELARLDPPHAAEIALLAAALLQIQNEGGTRLDLEAPLFDRRLRALGADAESIDRCRAFLTSNAPLLGAFPDRRPFLVDSQSLYFERALRLEIELATLLRRRLAAIDSRGECPALPRLPGPFALNDEQRAAVATVLTAVQRGQGGLVLVTGGPGTGKTFVVASLLRTLARSLGQDAQNGAPNIAIAFAAPTGKAADRMGQAIQQSIALSLTSNAMSDLDEKRVDQALATFMESEGARPRTLHNLLGFRPRHGDFRFHGLNQLPLSLLIVDEASMIDLAMMRHLLLALPPEAVLVLLGDADQLPSVEAGAVLRDLIATRDPRLSAATVRLVQSQRQSRSDPAGNAILGAARAINAGQLPEASFLVERASTSQVELFGVEHLTGDLPAMLERWFEASFTDLDACLPAPGAPDGFPAADFASLVRREYRIESRDGGLAHFSKDDTARLHALFASLSRRKILGVTRAQVDALNRWFHERHAADPRLFASERGTSFERAFVPGEPVMMCVNDSARGLFNGDQGVVLRVADTRGTQSFHAVFQSALGFRAHSLHALRGDLVHAFAMTVHKSQGSEYERVLFTLPFQDTPLLTREIVYTALTRARRCALIHGSRDLLTKGVSRRAERVTGLAHRLAQADD